MSWTKTKIGDFLFERKGKYKPSDKAIQGLKRIEKINFSGNFHIGDKSSKTNMILIKQGDLVISGINVAKGAMGIYNMENDVVATIHYSSYTFDEEKINVGYFKRFLRSAEFIRLLNEQIKGGIKTEIKPKHILPLEINLPNIETQNEIVSKFEKVETDIKGLNGEVGYQETLLKKIRQSILQDAIEGKLTASWREQNSDIESASVLLEKIKAEKEQLIKDKKIKKQKPLLPINEDEIPFDIPDSWEYCRLQDISNKIHYGVNASAKPEKYDVRLLRITDIQNNSVNWETVPGCDYLEKDLKSYSLNNNDILIARTGGTIGKSYIVKDITLISLFASYLIRVIPNSNLNADFLKLFIESPLYWKQLYEAAWGAGQPNVNGTSLSKLTLALPPLKEQKEIVKKIENLFIIFDELETQINSSKTNSQILMQAVLKEAFEK